MNLSPKSARRSTALPVGNTRKMEKSSKSDYGIFIAPLFGNIRAGELIKFLELSQLLGASYFTFYEYMKSLTMSRKCFIITKVKD